MRSRFPAMRRSLATCATCAMLAVLAAPTHADSGHTYGTGDDEDDFAYRLVENPQQSIFFVGYADPESPAGLLRDAAPGSEVQLDAGEAPQRVRCNLKQFQFSGKLRSAPVT